MLAVLGASALVGLGAVSFTFLSRKTMKKRLMEIMIACKIYSQNTNGILFPKITQEYKTGYGRRFYIKLPDGYPSELILQKWWIPISEALGKEISVDYDKGLIVDVYEDVTPNEIEYDPEKKTNKIAFAVNGKGKHYIDFEGDAPHYLIAGATGMGKSVLLRCILTSLAIRKNCPDLYLSDLKGGIELGLYKDLKSTKSFSTDLPELSNTLDMLVDEMYKRYEWMSHKSIVNYDGKRAVFVLDEMIDLYKTHGDPLGKLKSKIKYQLSELTAKGRAAGITLILCTQRPDAQVIDGIIKTNINNKICFKVVDSDQSQIVLGRGNTMAEKLPEIPGRCLMFMNTKKEIAQVFYLSYKKAKQLLEGVEKHADNKEPSTKDNEVGEDPIEFRRSSVSDYLADSEDS